MRTTVTLEPDVAALVKRTMASRGISFKQAVNDAIKAGIAGSRMESFETPVFRMGKPVVPLTHAVRLAAELEDEEIIRELGMRK